MTGRLEAYLKETATFTDVSTLFGYFDDFTAGYGFDYCVYAQLREQLQAVDLERGLIYHSFPPEWVDYYIDQNFYDIDPIVNIAPTQSKPYEWVRIWQMMRLTEEQKFFLKDSLRFGFPNGLSIPIFAAQGNIAYFALGCRQEKLPVGEAEITELQFICQQTHLRYMELGGTEAPDTVVLSPREKQVLYWIAQGKSNSVIAGILDISDHTVDTLVRRCFQKLGVTSRVSAALRGVCAGLIVA